MKEARGKKDEKAGLCVIAPMCFLRGFVERTLQSMKMNIVYLLGHALRHCC